MPGEHELASGIRRNTSLYVFGRDRVPLAVDVWMPGDASRGVRYPVVLRMTRYWRADHVGWLQRLAYGLHLVDAPDTSATVDFFNRRGFVMVAVDAPGTGASGGSRLTEWAPAEIANFADVARWASRQPWSNGRIGAIGVSYDGNTAEMLATTGEPAVKAVAPLFDDFDPQFGNSSPGGAFNSGFIIKWGRANAALDANDVCRLKSVSGLRCRVQRWWSDGVKRVDGDGGGKLAALLAKRRSNNILNALSGVGHRDDRLRDAGALRFADISPYGHRPAFERFQVPMLVLTGWMDAATTDGALSRYLSIATPQQLYIGAWSHGGDHDADPFAPTDASARPNWDRQLEIVAAFFDKHLRGDGATPSRGIVYRVMNGGWGRTSTWPPPGTRTVTMTLARRNGLSTTQAYENRVLGYKVDFSSGDGDRTRWHTQWDGDDVVYSDREGRDRALLAFTSAPLSSPIRIVGTPVLTLRLATSAPDGLLIAYLEAITPDGVIRYLTEGVLKLSNRQETNWGLPYVTLGVPRSFQREAARPMPRGVDTSVRLPLYATAVDIPAGSRIRVALAGAAAGLLDPIPASRKITWRIAMGGGDNALTLPVMPR